MENLNRVLLENVLPAHVAEHFLARNWKNEVRICYFFLLQHVFFKVKSCKSGFELMYFGCAEAF